MQKNTIYAFRKELAGQYITQCLACVRDPESLEGYGVTYWAVDANNDDLTAATLMHPTYELAKRDFDYCYQKALEYGFELISQKSI